MLQNVFLLQEMTSFKMSLKMSSLATKKCAINSAFNYQLFIIN